MRFALLLFLLVGLSLLRIGVAAFTPLTPEEAYLELLSAVPDTGYVDGTPGAALSIAAVRTFGREAVLTVRLSSVVFALAASLGLYFLMARITRESTAVWSVVVLNALPAFNAAATHAGATPGALAGSLLCLAFATHAPLHRTPLLLWLAAGAALALASQFALITLWLVPAVLLYTLTDSRMRRRFGLAGTVAFLIPPAISVAVLMKWNADHGWIWFAKGTLQSLLSLEFADLRQTLLGFDGFVLLMVGLVLAGLLVAAWRGPKDAASRLALTVAVPGGLVWLFQAMQGINELPVGLAVFPLAFAVLLEGLAALSALAAPAACTLLVLAASLWMIPDFEAAARENREWRPLAESMLAAANRVSRIERTPVFLVADSVPVASILGHSLRQIDPSYRQWPPVFVRESQDVQGEFTVWPRYDAFEETEEAPDEFFEELKAENPYRGQSAIYLSDVAPSDLPQAMTAAFERVLPLERIEVRAGPDTPRKLYYLYLCSDYQTLPF